MVDRWNTEPREAEKISEKSGGWGCVVWLQPLSWFLLGRRPTRKAKMSNWAERADNEDLGKVANHGMRLLLADDWDDQDATFQGQVQRVTKAALDEMDRRGL